jgi:hypothetical protein
MKFLTKHSNSAILQKNLVYRETNPPKNKLLKDELLKEQFNFCAYTEKYIQELDSSEVEHFNSSIKNRDDYYNYYAVIRNANLYKLDEKYIDANFFKTLFFQDYSQFQKRVKFEKGFYIEANEKDNEAKDLIDFLGFNHPELFKQRHRHLKRLRRTFEDAKYTKSQCFEYFKEHKEDLSFITAIEYEFDMKLDKLITNTTDTL